MDILTKKKMRIPQKDESEKSENGIKSKGRIYCVTSKPSLKKQRTVEEYITKVRPYLLKCKNHLKPDEILRYKNMVQGKFPSSKELEEIDAEITKQYKEKKV